MDNDFEHGYNQDGLHTVRMIEKLLSYLVSDSLQVPVWTIVLAAAVVVAVVWEKRKPRTAQQLFAGQLAEEGGRKGYKIDLVDLATAALSGTDTVCVFIVSTYTDGTPPESAAWFCKWLEEASTDFRMEKTLLRNMQYCVFGLGNSLYSDHYNTVGRNIDRWIHSMSGKRVTILGQGDEDVVNSRHGGIEEDFKAWRKIFWRKAGPVLTGRKTLMSVTGKSKEGCNDGEKCGGSCKCKDEGGACSSDEDQEGDEPLYETSSEEEDDDAESGGEEEGVVTQNPGGVVDLEDLGKVMKKMKTAKAARRAEESTVAAGGERKEMVTPQLRKALTKQGYRIIGSHSGVKLCRHHTNPVGTEWRWQMDDPELVFSGALESHVSMIKQFKGVPGVIAERFAEGLNPAHCALSLVGEPIMYPEINRFVNMLHEKHISTFLVTNAQFPDAITNLSPVTQLYVSVDASTKDSLKKIDRPLFKDFWERFLDSLRALSEKGQRTVYRLTLVKAFNTDEIDNYARLVSIGKPDFIEIKGVTFCGDSKASTLTMGNVPWHEEVVKFVQQFAEELPDYEIASEHEHSNCLLLAHKKFKVNGEWWTWIDYPRFHKLIKEWTESNGERTFTALDYMAKTPHWAVFGAREQGFDPAETRYFRKNPKKDIGGC
ncbi:TYW1-like protein [Mya arenaria]|uniref:tRNA 4-demethylwyosine synthase (AdoMet-dependent) n=1 Tax=Mya arenaria TaxID=6604 RepID=A0ABY7DZR1_MYAAR|nr:TYW1-like protein [Mya arenaria]